MVFEIARTGSLRSSGMTKRAVNDLPRVPGIPGVRIVGEPPEDVRMLRVRAAWERAPGGAVLSGWAAAVVHGVPESFLNGTRDGTVMSPVDLTVPADVGNYDTRGLRIRRSHVGQSHVVEIDGIVLTNGPRTALDLARWAPTPAKSLAMLDLAARFGLIERESFVHFLDPLGGLHRLKQVRELVPWVSSRAESVPESELRYHWRQAGLPAPLANQPVHDRFGKFVARVDLLDPESGLVGEYQGVLHRLDGAAEEDAARIQRLERMNLTVVEIWKDDMPRPEKALLEAYRRARDRDTRLDAWQCPPAEDW